MREITLQAPAKLNLTLDVLGRRPDGYHDLRMVMQSISLWDTVYLSLPGGPGEIRVRTSDAALPDGPDNLAWKAADAFFTAAGLPAQAVEITITKRIPFCAGMAGGSSDAAAVLRGLGQLLRPELDGETLEKIGEKVGSDVPFCVRGGTALAEGRGEQLRTMPGLPPCFLAVCKPAFGLSTPALFARMDACTPEKRPDTERMSRALAAGELETTAGLLCNVFEEVLTAEEAEEIGAIRSGLLAAGALGAVMTGSGPTVFGIFRREDDARRAIQAVSGNGRQGFVVQPL